MKIIKTSWRVKLLALLAVGIGPFLAAPAAQAFYSNGIGDGSSGSPYQITSCDQLGLIDSDASAHYVLVNDIDCGAVAAGPGSLPIAEGSGGFSGSFDGQGHVISGLGIDAPSDSYVGLFYILKGSAVVKNLTIYGHVTGSSHTGLLAGAMEDSSQVSRVDTHGSVTCVNNCGGLIGTMNSGTTLTRSWSDADVGGEGYTYGGLVGWANGDTGNVTISDVYYRGNVTPTGVNANYDGGIAGFAIGLNLSNSYATGSVSGYHYVGGIAGYLVQSQVSDSFSATEVMGVGMGAVFGGTVLSSYSSNYYDTNIVGSSSGDGYGSTPISDSAYFMQNSSSDVFDNWDFGNVWRVEYKDYPALAPISDPYMLCEEPHSTDTTINATCMVAPVGWGIPDWEARWQKQGDSGWHNITLDDSHVATATVTGLTPGTWYKLQFRYTNDFGTGQWGTVEILTTGTAPVAASGTTTTTSATSGNKPKISGAAFVATDDVGIPGEVYTPAAAQSDTFASNSGGASTADADDFNTKQTGNNSSKTKWGIAFLLLAAALAGWSMMKPKKQI